jgi:predicted nucleotidyltransferase
LSYRDLEYIVEKLRNRYKLFGVVLFGSRARGDYKPWSDYDVLIIGIFEKPYLERLRDVLETLRDVSIPVEPHPYTVEESIEMLSKGNPIIIDALSEGIVLYKTKEFEILENIFRDFVKRGLKKSNVSIILPYTNEFK